MTFMHSYCHLVKHVGLQMTNKTEIINLESVKCSKDIKIYLYIYIYLYLSICICGHTFLLDGLSLFFIIFELQINTKDILKELHMEGCGKQLFNGPGNHSR